MSCCSVFCSVITCMTLVMASPRKRVLSNFEEKKKLIFHADHPKCTQTEIASYFTVLWEKQIKRRTVGDI